MAETGTLIDAGFEGRADAAALNAGIWTADGSPQNAEYDTALAKVGTVSAYMKGPTTSGLAGEAAAMVLNANGAEFRFWVYHGENNIRRLVHDKAAAATGRSFFLDFTTAGNVETLTQRAGITGYTQNTSTAIGTYTASGWMQYAVHDIDFTNKTYRVSRRANVGDAWMGLKSAGASVYDIPFYGSDNITATTAFYWRIGVNGTVWVDDLRYSNNGIAEGDTYYATNGQTRGFPAYDLESANGSSLVSVNMGAWDAGRNLMVRVGSNGTGRIVGPIPNDSGNTLVQTAVAGSEDGNLIYLSYLSTSAILILPATVAFKAGELVEVTVGTAVAGGVAYLHFGTADANDVGKAVGPVVTVPEITGHPASTTVNAGNTATFTASATDATSQQWQVSSDGEATWDDLAGETSTTLDFTVPAIGTEDRTGWLYRCVFSNAQGSISTREATLAVPMLATYGAPEPWQASDSIHEWPGCPVRLASGRLWEFYQTNTEMLALHFPNSEIVVGRYTDDDGATWSSPVTVYDGTYAPIANSAGVDTDGSIFILIRLIDGAATPATEQGMLRVTCADPESDTPTFSAGTSISPPAGIIATYGRVKRALDGKRYTGMSSTGTVGKIGVSLSEDLFSTIDFHEINTRVGSSECAAIQWDATRWVAVSRHGGSGTDVQLEGYLSSDALATWSSPTALPALSPYFSVSPNLFPDRDNGRLYLFFSERSATLNNGNPIDRISKFKVYSADIDDVFADIAAAWRLDMCFERQLQNDHQFPGTVFVAPSYTTSTVAFYTEGETPSPGTPGENTDIYRFTIDGLQLSPDPMPPVAPSNLVATVDGDHIDLAWDDNSLNETGFKLERSIDGGAYAELDYTIAADTTSYIDTPVPDASTVQYRLCSTNAQGDSAPVESNEIALVTVHPHRSVISVLGGIIRR